MLYTGKSPLEASLILQDTETVSVNPLMISIGQEYRSLTFQLADFQLNEDNKLVRPVTISIRFSVVYRLSLYFLKSQITSLRLTRDTALCP